MKKIYVIFIFILLFVISSCSSMDGNMAMENIDSLSFSQFSTYKVGENEFGVYIPNNIEEALYYRYEIGTVKSNTGSWTINYLYNADYHVDEEDEAKEVWHGLYSFFKEKEKDIELRINYDINIFDPYSEVELEYVLTNPNKEEATYVIFYSYLPIRVKNVNTNKTHTVGIPVKLNMLLKTKDSVKNPFGDEMISWEDFLLIDKLKEI